MEDVAVMGCDRNPHVTVRRGGRSPLGGDAAFPITGPLRPATTMEPAGLPGVEPGPTRLELVVLPLHHRPTKRNDPNRTGLPGVAEAAVTRRSHATSQSASQATPT